ncbi:MAG: cytochrome b/b6 domain-containing protein [Rhodospirillales bacterium]|nr:cytochrome b/b6 domain-containing protein [Rhodospirillales bacterium]
MPQSSVAKNDPTQVKVWDGFVRVSHWVVVAGFFAAYLSEDDFLTLHVWAGYTVGVFVVLRILWGFVGPRHARFSDFVCGPGKVFGYLMNLLTLRAKRHLGHSPAGGAMVLVLLGGLLAIVWSGLVLYAVEEHAGPLAAVYGQVEGQRAPMTAAANTENSSNDEDDEHDEDEGDEFWEEVHEVLANLVLALVILHVAGVTLTSVVHRENLVRSMITGLKRANGDQK